MRRRLYDTIQVWGPGAIALISLLASISYGLGQERKIGRLEGRVYSQQVEQLESEKRLRQLEIDLKQLSSESLALRSDLDFESAKSQNQREKLIKKGWIE